MENLSGVLKTLLILFATSYYKVFWKYLEKDFKT